MNLIIKDIIYDGPYFDPGLLDNRSGVFVVLCEPDLNNNSILHVEESDKIRSRIEQHNKKTLWNNNCKGKLFYIAYYCDAATRITIKRRLIDHYNPKCQEIHKEKNPA